MKVAFRNASFVWEVARALVAKDTKQSSRKRRKMESNKGIWFTSNSSDCSTILCVYTLFLPFHASRLVQMQKSKSHYVAINKWRDPKKGRKKTSSLKFIVCFFNHLREKNLFIFLWNCKTRNFTMLLRSKGLLNFFPSTLCLLFHWLCNFSPFFSAEWIRIFKTGKAFYSLHPKFMAFKSPKSVKVVKLILAASSNSFNVFIPFALLEHSFSDNHRFIIHFIPLAAKCRRMNKTIIVRDLFRESVKFLFFEWNFHGRFRWKF